MVYRAPPGRSNVTHLVEVQPPGDGPDLLVQAPAGQLAHRDRVLNLRDLASDLEDLQIPHEDRVIPLAEVYHQYLEDELRIDRTLERFQGLAKLLLPEFPPLRRFLDGFVGVVPAAS